MIYYFIIMFFIHYYKKYIQPIHFIRIKYQLVKLFLIHLKSGKVDNRSAVQLGVKCTYLVTE